RDGRLGVRQQPRGPLDDGTREAPERLPDLGSMEEHGERGGEGAGQRRLEPREIEVAIDVERRRGDVRDQPVAQVEGASPSARRVEAMLDQPRVPHLGERLEDALRDHPDAAATRTGAWTEDVEARVDRLPVSIRRGHRSRMVSTTRLRSWAM